MCRIIKTKIFESCPNGVEGTNTYQDILKGTKSKTKAGNLACLICPYFEKIITEINCEGYDQKYYLCKEYNK